MRPPLFIPETTARQRVDGSTVCASIHAGIPFTNVDGRPALVRGNFPLDTPCRAQIFARARQRPGSLGLYPFESFVQRECSSPHPRFTHVRGPHEGKQKGCAGNRGVARQESTIAPSVSHQEPRSPRGRRCWRCTKRDSMHDQWLANILKTKESHAGEATRNFLVETCVVAKQEGRAIR
jgi:hypothetical protein